MRSLYLDRGIRTNEKGGSMGNRNKINIARHEAGHVVNALTCGMNFETVTIVGDGRSNHGPGH